MVTPTADPKKEAAGKLLDLISSAQSGSGTIDSYRTSRTPSVEPTPVEQASTRADGVQRSGGLVDLISSAHTGDEPGSADSLSAFATRNSGNNALLDRRIDEIQTELPKLETNIGDGGWWGTIKDIVGRPIGAALTTLDAPAAGLEHLVGMMYFNEVPLAERWTMSAWAYDSMYSQVFYGASKNDIVADARMGLSKEEMEAKHGTIGGDLIGHSILDPLNLVGVGVALLPFKGLKAAGGALDFAKIPFLQDVPVLRRLKLGGDINEEISAKMMAEIDNPAARLTDFTAPRSSGWIARLTELTPQAKVDIAHSDGVQLFSALGAQADNWAEVGTRTEMGDLLRRIDGEELTNTGLENSTSFIHIQQVAKRTGRFRMFYDNAESLKPIDSSAFWDKYRPALMTTRDGAEVSMVTLLRQGTKLTPEEAAKYAHVRTIALLEDWNAHVPSLYDAFQTPGVTRNAEKSRNPIANFLKGGGFPHNDPVQQAAWFSAGMKGMISFVTLNTPAFAGMNYLNNAFMIGMKTGNWRGAATYMAHPYSGGKNVAHILEQAKSPIAFASEIGYDAAPGKWGRKVGVFLDMASKFDEGMRNTLYADGAMKANRASWNGGSSFAGLKPALSADLQAIPGLSDAVDGLAVRGQAGIDELEAAFTSDTSAFLSGESIVSSWARSDDMRRFTETAADPAQAAHLYMEKIPDGFVEDMTERLIDKTRAARRANQVDWIEDFQSSVLDMRDEIDLEVFDAAIRDGMQAPIDLARIRNRVAPWQDEAFFVESQMKHRELYQRLITLHGPSFGTSAITKVVQDEILAAMSEYQQEVRTLMQAARQSGTFSHAVQSELSNAVLKQFDARQAKIDNVLGWRRTAGAKSFGTRISEYMKNERDILSESLAMRGASFDGGVDWSTTIEMAHQAERAQIEKTWQMAGLEYSKGFPVDEYPIAGGAEKAMAEHLHSVLSHAEREIPERFRNARSMTADEIGKVRELIDGVPAQPRVSGRNNPQAAKQLADLDAEMAALEVRRNASAQRYHDATVRDTQRDFSQAPGSQLSPDELDDVIRRGQLNEYQIATDPIYREVADARAEALDLIDQKRALQDEISRVVNEYTWDATAGRDGLRQAMAQRDLFSHKLGAAFRDWGALNYAQKYGIDGALANVFPYHFWIGRTTKDWMRITASKPGATAAIARMYDAIAEINADADIPDRLKRNIQIPFPFIGDIDPLSIISGGPGKLFFDPIRVLYPLAGLQDAEDFASPNRTLLGQAHDYAGQLPVGSVNPFVTGVLGGIGALGDRDTYLRRALGSVRGVGWGIPGPRALRAAHDWLTGVVIDPDETELSEEVKLAIAKNEAPPEAWVMEVTRHVWELATSDGFDTYRTERMVANMVGEDPDRWSTKAGLEALKYHKGPLWAAADQRARTAKGLEALTGWALMPIRAYPEGEQIQRALDSMYRDIRTNGTEADKEAFFKQHPEYQVRTIMQANRNEEDLDAALDTDLFYIDLAEVQKKYDPHIEELKSALRRAEQVGYLQTKEGRRMAKIIENDMGVLYSLREQEIAKFEPLYGTRKKEASLRIPPAERAMFALREQYYSIKLSNFKSFDEFEAARSAFLEKLPASPVSAGTHMAAAVDAATVWNAAEARAAVAGADRKKIYADRERALLALTERSGGQVSREEFLGYLHEGQTAPTADRIEYKKAVSEIESYHAIAQAPGVSATAAKAYQRAYWQSHPLLTKYFGADEPKAWNADSAAAYGRMDQIWDGYYKLGGNKMGQRDYLGLHLEELNSFRVQVGLYKIRLVDWKPVISGDFQPKPQPKPR